eukprot:g3642.t1
MSSSRPERRRSIDILRLQEEEQALAKVANIVRPSSLADVSPTHKRQKTYEGKPKRNLFFSNISQEKEKEKPFNLAELMQEKRRRSRTRRSSLSSLDTGGIAQHSNNSNEKEKHQEEKKEKTKEAERRNIRVNEPRASLKCFQLVDRIQEKLKLLDYDQALLQQRTRRDYNEVPTLPSSASILHFAFPASSSMARNNRSLFDDFIALSQWLYNSISIENKLIIDPYQTPTNRLDTLLINLQSIGFEMVISPQTILRRSFGMEVCTVLDFLCDASLMSKQFTFTAVSIKEESLYTEAPEGLIDEVDADLIHSDIESNNSEDESFETLPTLHSPNSKVQDETPKQIDHFNSSTLNVIRTNIDASLWEAEVKRVLPQLKQSRKVGADWRMRLQETKNFHSKIDKMATSVPRVMKTLSTRLRETIDNIK